MGIRKNGINDNRMNPGRFTVGESSREKEKSRKKEKKEKKNSMIIV